MYEATNVKGGNRTSLVICTKVPLPPLPKTQPDTHSYYYALDHLNLRLYQTQIELNAAREGEIATATKLEDLTRAHETSLKELSAAKKTIAALRLHLKQSSENIQIFQFELLSKETHLTEEKEKVVSLTQRLDAALDEAALEKRQCELMAHKAEDCLMHSRQLVIEKQVLHDGLKTSDIYLSLSVVGNIGLSISLAIVMVLLVQSSSAIKTASSSSPHIELDASNTSKFSDLPKSDSFNPRLSNADPSHSAQQMGVNAPTQSTGSSPTPVPSVDVEEMKKTLEEDQKEIEEAKMKENEIQHDILTQVKPQEEKDYEEVRRIKAWALLPRSDIIIDSDDDSMPTTEGRESLEPQIPEELLDNGLEERCFTRLLAARRCDTMVSEI